MKASEETIEAIAVALFALQDEEKAWTEDADIAGALKRWDALPKDSHERWSFMAKACLVVDVSAHVTRLRVATKVVNAVRRARAGEAITPALYSPRDEDKPKG